MKNKTLQYVNRGTYSTDTYYHKGSFQSLGASCTIIGHFWQTYGVEREGCISFGGKLISRISTDGLTDVKNEFTKNSMSHIKSCILEQPNITKKDLNAKNHGSNTNFKGSEELLMILWL